MTCVSKAANDAVTLLQNNSTIHLLAMFQSKSLQLNTEFVVRQAHCFFIYWKTKLQCFAVFSMLVDKNSEGIQA